MASDTNDQLLTLLYGALTTNKKTALEKTALEKLSDLEEVEKQAYKASENFNDEIINPLKNELLALAAEYAQVGKVSPTQFFYPSAKK